MHDVKNRTGHMRLVRYGHRSAMESARMQVVVRLMKEKQLQQSGRLRVITDAGPFGSKDTSWKTPCIALWSIKKVMYIARPTRR